MAIDLLDVVKGRLEEAGLERVYTTLPNSSERDAVVLSMGTSGLQEHYMDGTVSGSVRVTVLCKSRTDPEAREDALRAERALRASDLSSADGSYETDGIRDVGIPVPLARDPAGSYAYALDLTISTTRKDF